MLEKYPTPQNWILYNALEEKPFVLIPDDQNIAFSEIAYFFDHSTDTTAIPPRHRLLSYEFDLKLEPTVEDNGGRDVFWYAERAINITVVKEALRMPIQELLSKQSEKAPIRSEVLEYKESAQSLASQTKLTRG